MSSESGLLGKGDEQDCQEDKGKDQSDPAAFAGWVAIWGRVRNAGILSHGEAVKMGTFFYDP
jgi:hypothetical protein